MCSYCGCEAEAAIASLTADHAVIADLSYRLHHAVVDRKTDEAVRLTVELADIFARHSRREEQGLFTQLLEAGEAVDEVGELVAQHRRLRADLSVDHAVNHPDRLVATLAELARHAEIEDYDLFPYAMQQMPDACWDRLPGDQLG